MTERQLKSLLERKFGRATVAGGGNGTEIIVECPFCGHRKLSVNARKLVWQCWHCGESGTARKLLGRDVKVERPERPERRQVRLGYIPPGDTVPVGDLPEEHEAVVYLSGRKFDHRLISDAFGVSYCRAGRKFGGGVFDTSGTIVLPISENGSDIAWQARLLYDPSKVPPEQAWAYGWKREEDGSFVRPPKYFTSPGFRKGEHFFNLDNARRFRFTVVTEGAFDAMRVGMCAVAAFGKGLTDDQVSILRDGWPLVVLLLDPDAASDQEALKAKYEERA